jgi:hypothetical protein
VVFSVVVVVVVVCSVVLELIGAGVSTMTGAGAGVSTTTAAGAGVSTTTAAGAGVSTVAGDWVTVTLELGVFGMRLTFVFVPTEEPLPAPPTELLV